MVRGRRGDILNFRELLYIYTIAKHKNISKAAQELYVTQPTLSKYLQKLEQDLGTKLFSYINHQYVPTYIGKRYLHYIEKIFMVKNDWDKELIDLLKLNQGQLNIIVPLLRSATLASATLPLFFAKYPNIKINLHEEVYAAQEKLLLNEQFDMAILNELSQNDQLAYQVLGEEETLLVVANHHQIIGEAQHCLDRKYPWVDIKLLENERFIMQFPEQRTGKMTLGLLEEENIHPNILLQTKNAEVALQMTAKGLGVCFVPETYLQHMTMRDQVKCFSVGKAPLISPIVVSYRKGAYLPQYAVDYIEIIRQYLVKQ